LDDFESAFVMVYIIPIDNTIVVIVYICIIRSRLNTPKVSGILNDPS
jgi:hypothetical protein